MFGGKKRIEIIALAGVVAALMLVPGNAQASGTTKFRAVFHDAFPSGCAPPVVFCGSGTVARYGRATTVVRATPPVPISGTDCSNVAGRRWITLDDGSGTLVSSFTGIRCALGEAGHAFRIRFHSVIDPEASSGVFAGATGGGRGLNMTNRNRQMFRLAWKITLG